jgi:hypothetical protein
MKSIQTTSETGIRRRVFLKGMVVAPLSGVPVKAGSGDAESDADRMFTEQLV